MEKLINNPNITKEELKKKVIASINKKSLEDLNKHLGEIELTRQEYNDIKKILKTSNVPEISIKYYLEILGDDISYNNEFINVYSSIEKPLEEIIEEINIIKASIKENINEFDENVSKFHENVSNNELFEDMETASVIVAIANEIEAIIKKVMQSHKKLKYEAVSMTDCFYISEACEFFNELRYKMLRLTNSEQLLEIREIIDTIKGDIKDILDTDISFVEEIYYLERERNFHITDSKKLKDIVTQIYSREAWDF